MVKCRANKRTIKEHELIDATIEDMDLLFDWVNDKQCRQSAFNSEKIEYEEHKVWFLNKLSDTNCKIYLYLYKNKKIGQVRIDIDKENAIIAYSVQKEFRGQGHGFTIVDLLEKKIIEENDVRIVNLIGNVKKSNLTSRRVFEKLGYDEKDKTDYILYHKKLAYNQRS